MFFGLGSETLIIALATLRGLPRINCITLHADHLPEQPGFCLGETSHAGAVEAEVIMICARTKSNKQKN
ncbi:uncharacterized protein METZ01_LOCUS245671 [marine metagenome]|uniref:Uncharacterized protein n=1 Tax=marine metagenome TaxID=408172 RepID=A0A382I0Q6_9ZZZZ